MKEVILGGCEFTPETLRYAYDKGVRTFDLGFGYQGEGVADVMFGDWYKTLEKKDDIKVINKFPLFDKIFKTKFGISLYSADDNQLEDIIRKTISIQMERNGVNKYYAYLLHAVFDGKYTFGYNTKKDLDLYKRVVGILVKLKKEGLIENIGFSAHVDFNLLYYFVNEIDPKGDIFDIAMVSYNILNEKGSSAMNPPALAKHYNIMVWDAPGLEGVKLLKEKGYKVLDMMPTESGRISFLSTSKDWFDWAFRFVRDCKYVDSILAGTSSIKHLQQILDIFNEEDIKNIPDMRILNPNSKVCGINA